MHCIYARMKMKAKMKAKMKRNEIETKSEESKSKNLKLLELKQINLASLASRKLHCCEHYFSFPLCVFCSSLFVCLSVYLLCIRLLA